jgi:guanine nucleotide-binding protein G(I)/G(S)/G(T) subunit beta-1
MSDESKQLLGDIENLKKQIAEIRNGNEESLRIMSESKKIKTKSLDLKTRRVLKGHFGKVYALNWSTSHPEHLVSASQDGKLLVWNAVSLNKCIAIPLASSWVMTCSYSPSGNFVASGGLDNMCSMFKINLKSDIGVMKDGPTIQLAQHQGYVSSIKFLSDQSVLTSSGDTTIKLWDVERKSVVHNYTKHGGDVMGMAIFEEKGIFASCSIDGSCRVWDVRDSRECVTSFYGHESDVNSVDFFKDGNAIATAADDATIRLFDLRSLRCLNVYGGEKILAGITSCKFSKTGRFLFGGYDDFNLRAWDTMTAKEAQSPMSHEDRVSCLDVSAGGNGIATGCWNSFIRIWA